MAERGKWIWQLMTLCLYFNVNRALPLRHGNGLDNNYELDGIIEEDIKLTDFNPYDTLGDIWLRSVIDRTRIWTNGVVPYHIDENYFNEVELETIRSAIEEFHNKTCIRFVERKKEMPYLIITPLTRCWSEIGMPKEQEAIRTLSLGPSCLDRRGTIIHELMHVLGFWHEQNRADRDDYVVINWTNIRDGLQHNFYKYGEEKVDTMHEPYDYQSIMHYSSFAFAKDPHKPTIETKIPAMIGQRFQLSQLDIKKLHKLYNCASSDIDNGPPSAIDVDTNQLLLTATSMPDHEVHTTVAPTVNPDVPNIADLMPLPFKFNWTNENLV